jgi:molybdate/tungstate transport system substrate-binding protein
MRRVCRGGLIGAALMLTARNIAVSSQSAGQLTVCHAGSVQLAFAEVEKAFAAQHPAIALKDISGGSVALAARLAAGRQACDVYAAADYQDIDLLLKPQGIADYTIVFAKGRMVLAYLETDPTAKGIAAAGDFNPPTSIPNAASDWYKVLLAPGVRVSSSHPFLDPGGYRTHMIFQLAQMHYKLPNLSSSLLEHVTINAMAAADGANRPTLGKDFNFQFIYEHSAAAAAKSNPSYRYVALPDTIDLSTTSHNGHYAQASVTIPGVGPSVEIPSVTIPATRVAWGLTIPKRSANPENALAFVIMLLGSSGVAALNANGPVPIAPALVTSQDYARVPKAMQSLVKAGPILP